MIEAAEVGGVAALDGSFRDPSGFLFRRGGRLYRQVNRSYQGHYDRLMGSGLYGELTGAGLLIPHEEVEEEAPRPREAYKVLRPEVIPFVSYPYEWSFGQLKDAARLTLDIHRRAVARGMVLKDASAYNVQFRGARPVFIDSLSFEEYREGEAWVAYRQFCQHFYAPLLLMARVDVRLNQLLRTNIDGVPLGLAGTLLPARSRLRLGPLLHVHLHAGVQRNFAGTARKPRARNFSRAAMLGLIDSLDAAIRSCRWSPRGTEWADYYRQTNYSDAGQEHKAALVGEFLDPLNPRTVWDLGANTGRFSRVATARGATVVAFDVDPACVELNYREAAAAGDGRLLPLLLDLTNPSPALGWGHRERMSLEGRGPADVVMALALVHHLAIANNVPLGRVAEYLARLGGRLIIEFVPKSDSQVRRLLATREDIFPDYTREGFEGAFAGHFATERAEPVRDSERTLYLMRSVPPR